jgi:hyperosmotically inducible protein
MLLTVLSGALAACATVDRTEDMRIESEVKARLVAEKDANLTRLGVVSSDATVYLSGAVASREQRAQAEALARGVRGVRRVVNTVEVVTPPR